MEPKRIVILVNLDAKQGMAGTIWKKISYDVLSYLPDTTEIITYKIPFDIERVIKELINSKKVDAFISAGGDGSLNFVLNALMKMDNTAKFCLGSIGLGSSNDFLKPHANNILNIPVKINWLQNQLTDVGSVQYENSKGVLNTQYFLINANIGVTAYANYLFNHPGKILAGIKKKWTNAAIMLTAVKGILFYRNYPIHLVMDKTISKQIILSNLSVLKNPHISGKFRYAQKILHDDGFLGLNYCRHMNKIELLTTLFGMMKGKFKTNSKRKSFKIKQLEVFAKSPVPIETDGEVFMGKTFTFNIIPRAIYTMGL